MLKWMPWTLIYQKSDDIYQQSIFFFLRWKTPFQRSLYWKSFHLRIFNGVKIESIIVIGAIEAKKNCEWSCLQWWCEKFIKSSPSICAVIRSHKRDTFIKFTLYQFVHHSHIKFHAIVFSFPFFAPCHLSFTFLDDLSFQLNVYVRKTVARRYTEMVVKFKSKRKLPPMMVTMILTSQTGFFRHATTNSILPQIKFHSKWIIPSEERSSF